MAAASDSWGSSPGFIWSGFDAASQPDDANIVHRSIIVKPDAATHHKKSVCLTSG
jgi:hypothetical protein